MNKRQRPVKVRSLPPITEGDINGYLTMKVDEIVWCRESCMNAVVLVQWWGENEPAMFRPMNVKSNLSGITTNTTVCYEIRTNSSLFEEYLKDCEVLELSVADEDLITIVGLVTIRGLSVLIRDNPYQYYFPIVNAHGNRIGDLHVGFSLQFMSVQEVSRHRAVACEESAINGQRRRLKQYPAHYKNPLKCEILPSHTSPYTCGIYRSQKSRESQIPDSVISDILEQGQRLRNSMVRSVLEDGDIALVDNYIDVLQSDSSTYKNLSMWNEGRKVFVDDAKVLEFLSGFEFHSSNDVCCMITTKWKEIHLSAVPVICSKQVDAAVDLVSRWWHCVFVGCIANVLEREHLEDLDCKDLQNVSNTAASKLCHHPETGSTVAMNCHENPKRSISKTMTHQDEECAMEILKNMSPVPSLLEMAEELGKKDYIIAKDCEALEKESSKTYESLQEADIESLVPSPEKGSSNESTEEHGTHNAASSEINVEPLQSEGILHSDFLMKNVDSLQITVHSLTINSDRRNRHQNCVQSGSHLTQSENKKMNLLYKLPMQCGAVYFVEYEFPYPLYPVLRNRRLKKERDGSRYLKNNRPWHTKVKRFCSRNKIGSDIYFGRSSVHMLPTSKTSLHKLLRDVNIAFRIYSRQLSQKIPSKIGEAHLSMTDILKSETFSSCKDIAVLNTTKIPECQVPIGVLKVTVELGSEQKYFGNNFVEKISNEGWGTEADSDYGGVKLGIHEYNTEASLKHVSDPRPAPKHHASNISRRFFKNRRKIISCNINMDPEFSKNSQQKTELEDQVLDSSLSETSLNKPVLLHGLLHISEGQGFEGLNSYLVCRAFWKEDVFISDICCKAGSALYNFHELIPVLLSADLLERSHNNVLVVELWEKRLTAECDLLIGIAKLPLNKFFIAYRDPVVAAQLLLSKYPVISVDGWVNISNPVTGLPSGRLNVVLALGTEDQIHLLEVSRGLKETLFIHSLQNFQEPVPASHDDSHIMKATPVRDLTSTEPFSCSVANHHEPLFSRKSESQARHINSSLSVTSELPQSIYEHTHTLESLQEHSCDDDDSVPILDTQEHVRNISVDVSDSASISHRMKDQGEQNNDTELQGSSFDNVVRHLPSKNNRTTKSNVTKVCSIQNQGPAVSFKHASIRNEKYSQQPSIQYSVERVKPRHLNDDSFEAQEFCQSIVDQQVKHSQGGHSSHSGSELQTYDTSNAKIGTYHPLNKHARIVISTKHQESQTDSFVVNVTSCETVTLQNTSKDTASELPRGPPLDIIHEVCVSSSEVSNVQPGDMNDSHNSSFSENEHMKERLRDKELSHQCTHTSLSLLSDKLKSDLKVSTVPCTDKLLSSESEGTDLNRDSFLGNQTSKAEQLSSVLHESVASKSAEIDPESNFHVHLEIERAMHLRCFRQHEGGKTVAGVIEPSTYVSFLLKQSSPGADESGSNMFTPLVSNTASPSWHWHCDTWLSSDLLTNNCKRMIFKVWQSVNESCKDPTRDTVLGFAAVDLTVLLFGMPWVSGWFSIMDFAGQCSGQIKISITPLENLSRFNQYKTSEPEVPYKLQGNCSGKHGTCFVDCQKTLGEKRNCRDSCTVTFSCEIGDKTYDEPCPPSERSVLQSSEVFTSKSPDTCDVLLHHTNNGPDGFLSSIRNCSTECDAQLQDDMKSSYLSQALKQKLIELDEITQRLKRRLHVVANEDFTPPFLPCIQETENSISSQSVSHSITNTNEKKNSRSKALSFLHEEANEGTPNFEVTIADSPNQVTMGYSRLATNTNDTEGFHLKAAEENRNIPRNCSKKCEHFQSNIVYPLQMNIPPSNVTNIQCCVEKENENDIVRTSMNHTGSLVNVCYPYYPGSCSKTSTHLRRSGCELADWKEVVCKPVLNGTRLLPVERRSETEDTDDFDRLTDYLMKTSARELELENVFNPLLFHQLLSSCSGLDISGFCNRHDIEHCCMSPKVSKETVGNCSDYKGVAILGNVEVDVTRTQSLLYNSKNTTHLRNDSPCVNSNSEKCDVSEAETKERNFETTEESRVHHTEGEVMASVSSLDMGISNVKHLDPCGSSLETTEHQEIT